MHKDQLKHLITSSIKQASNKDIDLSQELYEQISKNFWLEFLEGLRYAVHNNTGIFVIRSISVLPLFIPVVNIHNSVWEWAVPKLMQELYELKLQFVINKEIKKSVFTFYVREIKQFIDLCEGRVPGCPDIINV